MSDAYSVCGKLLIRNVVGGLLTEATFEDAVELVVELARERAAAARTMLATLVDTIDITAGRLLTISDDVQGQLAALDGKSNPAPTISDATVQALRVAIETKPMARVASSAGNPSRAKIWTDDRILELNRLYAEGGQRLALTGFPDLAPTSILNAIAPYVTVASKQAWLAQKAASKFRPIDAALDASFSKPPIEQSAPEPVVGRLVESAAPAAPRPVATARPRVNSFRPKPKMRSLAAEERPVPMNRPAPRRSAPLDSNRACIRCGATAFTLPVDARLIGGPRECRSQADCARRQAAGGVANMALLPGPRAGIAPASPASMSGYSRK